MLAFGYVLLFAVIALEVPLALNFSRRVDSEVRSEASTGAQAVAAAASGRLGARSALDDLVRRQARATGGRVLVVGAAGRVLSDSAGTGLRGAPYGSRPEITAALQGRVAQGTRRSDSLGEDILYTAVPVVERGRTRGAVRVTQSVGAVRREVRKDVLALVGLGLAVLAIGLALAWVIAGSLSTPLRGLAATARRIAGGDLQARAEPAGSAEQVEVAHAFNDMTERLVRSLGAQREFVANASHQLRTPLTGLRLRLEAAGLKARGDDALRRDLAAAEHEAERLGKLVGDLLSLAEDGQRPPTGVAVSLAAAARRAAERWAPRAEIELEGTGEGWALASPGDVDTMLDALIENALHYGGPESPVTVAWDDAPAISVLDRGPGLAPGEREQVFERFYRGSASRGGASGTGLGLTIVGALARRWGGTAELRDRPGGGTLAAVRLTAATAPARTEVPS